MLNFDPYSDNYFSTAVSWINLSINPANVYYYPFNKLRTHTMIGYRIRNHYNYLENFIYGTTDSFDTKSFGSYSVGFVSDKPDNYMNCLKYGTSDIPSIIA